jgi:hypothetical protein
MEISKSLTICLRSFVSQVVKQELEPKFLEVRT